jgi:VWFA-related protein
MSRTARFVLLAAFLVLGTTSASRGQGPAASQDDPAAPQRFGTATTAVMVDVVVRDKRGNPVTDLTAADFELLEDETRQEIGSVTLVAPGTLAAGGTPSTAVAPGAPPPTANTVEAPTFVALAFDRLSPEGRALAHKGALAYLETARDNDFAGVFLVDNTLEMIQTYTTDRGALRKGIDAASSRASASFSRQSDKVRSGSRGDTHAGTSPTAGAESAGPRVAEAGTPPTPGEGVAPSPGGITEALFEQMASRMERSYESMVRDQQGFATTNALLALIDALGMLPGRKTVVFFAEGIAIPAAVQARFDSVVATANRANVSVYTVDAAGLRVHSQSAETARNVRDIADINLDRVSGASEGGGAYTKDLELNEDVLRQDPSVALGMLAERTGGFLINNTNALERGFRTIDADRRFHYLLTYSPQNSDFNGEWRQITVRVPKRDVQVRSRTGYLAVRAPGALPVLAYEGPALAALDDSPLPTQLPVRGSLFSFPDAKGPGRHALLVSAEARALTVETAGGSFRTDFTILARIKDGTGEVVRKASQPYRLNGPAAQADSVKQGDVLFFRQPDL